MLEALTKKKRAMIVNVSSIVAYTPLKSSPSYCATKAAVHSFTKSLRYHIEKTKVKVVEVLPPSVDTYMTRGMGGRKVSPVFAASAIIKGMRRNKKEVRIGVTKLLFYLNRLFPGVVELIMKRR